MTTGSFTQDEKKSLGGRPEVPIDEALVITFLEVGMPVKKIAAYFNCTTQTLYNRMGNVIKQQNTLFDFELLQKQKELAMAGSEKMLIHLGKTRLQQSEVVTNDDDTSGAPEWTVSVPKFEAPKVLTAEERAELEGDDDEA